MEEGEGKEDEDVEDRALNPVQKPVEKKKTASEMLVIVGKGEEEEDQVEEEEEEEVALAQVGRQCQ